MAGLPSGRLRNPSGRQAGPTPRETAAIEQIMIRGVDGPRELHATLVEDACLS